MNLDIKEVRAADSGLDSEQTWNLTYGNSLFVAVGSGGGIRTSSDGITWINRESGTHEILCAVIYANETFVAVGLDIILYSVDGINWATATNIDPHDYDAINLCAIAYGNDRFVAVGYDGELHTSYDGIKWTRQKDLTDGDLHGIAYGNGRFVAVGPCGFVLTSTDGIYWNKEISTLTYLNRIIFDNNMFVAVGENGTILTSPDGIDWNKSVCTDYYLWGVAYGNKKFIAVGNSGVILASLDGIEWENIESPIHTHLENIVYANNQFVSIGYGCNIFIIDD